MEFRKQGNRIYLLRSVYDPEAQRCRQRTVGKLDRYSLPTEEQMADLCEGLTEDEQQEVRDWVAERQAKDQALQLDWEFRSAGMRLKALATTLASEQTPEITRDLAAEIHEGIAAIQLVLKRAGWPKSKLGSPPDAG